MKQEGRLDRYYLKGPVGNEIQVRLVGIGHNFRTILKKLRLLYVILLRWMEGQFLLNKRENNQLNATGQMVVAVQA
jgi:hypothetical protein